jgi:hypothetical protein
MKKTLKLNCSSQFVILLFLILLGSLNGFAQDANEALKKVDKQFFIENKGQWDREVLYMTKMGGLNTWITRHGIVYDFYKINDAAISKGNNKDTFFNNSDKKPILKEFYGQVIKIELQKANVNPETEGSDKSKAYYNYMIGNDKTKWASNVGLYKDVRVKSIYSGIDLRYYFDNGSIRYDYLVNTGASIDAIKMNMKGSDKVSINKEGELVFNTRFGEVKQQKLVSYQKIRGQKIIIESKFQILSDENVK